MQRAVVFSISNVAGMIDMVVLPLWVGVLISRYAFDPAQAGGMVTCFLLGVVLASAIVAPAFARIPRRQGVVLGYALAAIAFLALGRMPVGASGFAAMAAWHAVAGFGVGCGLSITHGTIGRTRNPHLLFGLVNVALGVFGVLTYVGLPALIAALGPAALFGFFVAVMAVACVVCAAFFPRADTDPVRELTPSTAIPASAWLVVLVVICLTFNQAMMFSFFSQLGVAHGFSEASVGAVLIAVGFINLLPGALAALLQTRLSALAVGFAGPVVQAVLALVISTATTFPPYALAGALYVSVVIFTHTFLFGLLARLDASGRCVAATPAMMMTGSCTGPAAAGLIVSLWGYGALGWAAAIVSTVAVCLLGALRLNLQAAQALTPARS